MAKNAYIGIDGISRRIKAGYLGIDGIARKIKKAYIGIDGVAKELQIGGAAIDELFAAMQVTYTKGRNTASEAAVSVSGGIGETSGTYYLFGFFKGHMSISALQYDANKETFSDLEVLYQSHEYMAVPATVAGHIQLKTKNSTSSTARGLSFIFAQFPGYEDATVKAMLSGFQYVGGAGVNTSPSESVTMAKPSADSYILSAINTSMTVNKVESGGKITTLFTNRTTNPSMILDDGTGNLSLSTTGTEAAKVYGGTMHVATWDDV